LIQINVVALVHLQRSARPENRIEKQDVLNRLKLLLAFVSVIGLAAGFLAPVLGMNEWQHTSWGAAAMIVLLFLARQIFTSLRRGEFGLDIVAALSMSTALYFGETLAAAVVSLMYSGGQLLEDFAEARARSEMNLEIAQRSRRIALQSVYVGLALSLGAMVAAAFGYLSVVECALFQEVIDVAVILNALRTLR